MNIFVLDLNPKLCAQYHCDRHVVKMILEHAQLLCAVHSVNGYDAPYRLTHKNHPCAIWVRESRDNYDWLVEMTYHLNDEYKKRYNHNYDHKSFDIIKDLPKPEFLERLGVTERPLAMPAYCKIENDVVASYRNYYIKEKHQFASWKNEIPSWFSDKANSK